MSDTLAREWWSRRKDTKTKQTTTVYIQSTTRANNLKTKKHNEQMWESN